MITQVCSECFILSDITVRVQLHEAENIPRPAVLSILSASLQISHQHLYLCQGWSVENCLMDNGPNQLCSCVRISYSSSEKLSPVLHSHKNVWWSLCFVFFLVLFFFFFLSISKNWNSFQGLTHSYKNFTNPRDKLLLLYLIQLTSTPTPHKPTCSSSSPARINWSVNLSSLQQPRQHNCTFI